MSYKTYTNREKAIKYAKENRLKVVRGRADGGGFALYFVGSWNEPMVGTIYKPEQEVVEE